MSTDPLSDLEVSARNELESLLMEFDGDWKPDSIARFGGQLDSHPEIEYRRLALAELIKIDLQRCWKVGTRKRIEDYLRMFPQIGSSESVSAELIAAEYDARNGVDAELSLASYESRFPAQFEEVTELVQHSMESRAKSSSPVQEMNTATLKNEREAQASIDTSRVDPIRDTKEGEPTDPLEDLPVEFGRYRILKELGSGAMGKVFLAHDSQLDRQVALKTPSFRGSEDGDMVTRFYREARAAAKLQHRNICPIYDVGEIEGRHFISMAFVKGRCMSDFIKPDKLPPQRTSAILVQRIAVALSEAHKHNVIHRDLKPANIMIDLKKEPIVMDFGLARQMDNESRVTQSGMAVGTPAYMSPEQVRGELDEVGAAADIYALGVILYELLTGQLPFRGPIAKVVYGIVNEEPTAPSAIREGIETELEAICAKMMAKDRTQRFQSMDDVARALKTYAKGEGLAQKTSPSSIGKGKATSPTSSSSGLTETGALNAFFAAHAEATASGTEIESLRPAVNAQASIPAKIETQPKTHRNARGNRRGRHGLVIASGFGAVMLALLGVVIYFKGGKIELDDDADTVVEVTENGNLLIKPAEPSVAQAPQTPTQSPAQTSQASAQPSQTAIQPSSQQTPAATGSRESDGTGDVQSSDYLVESLTIQNEGGGVQFALSPDGEQLVTTGAGSPGRFTLWDADTGQQLSQVTDPEHAGLPTSFPRFTPDGKRMMYSVDKSVKVIDLETGALVHKTELSAPPKIAQFPHRSWTALHYLPPSQSDPRNPGRLLIWDWENGRMLYDEPTTTTRFLSISPDGKFLFLNTQNYHVRHTVDWDGTELRIGPGVRFESTSRIRSPCNFSPDGRYAANSLKSNLGMAVLMDVATGQIVRYLEPELAKTKNHSHRYGANVVFTHDGSRLVTANYLGRVALWDRESGQLIREIAQFPEDSGHWSPKLAVTPSGRLFVGTDPIRVYQLPVEKPAVNERSVNLLPRIELERDVILGNWKIDNGTLVSPPGWFNRLHLPYDVPEEYQITVGTKGNAGMHLALLVGGSRVLVALDNFPKLGYRSGLQKVDGKTLQESPLTRQGQLLPAGEHTVSASVRRVRDNGDFRVLVEVDGEAIIDWTGSPDRLSNIKEFRVPNASQVTLGSSDGSMRFTSILLTKHTPIGVRDAAQRIVDVGGRFATVDSSGWKYRVPKGDFRVNNILFPKGCDLQDSDIDLLKRFPELEIVSFYEGAVTDAGFKQLGELTSVKALHFQSGCAIGDDGLAAVAKLDQLESLSLFHTQVTDAGLSVLTEMPSLESLVIGTSFKGQYGSVPISDAGLVHLSGIKNLTDLYVGGPVWTSAAAEHIGRLAQLESLDFGSPTVDDQGLEPFARLQMLRDLTLLTPEVSDEGVARLLAQLPDRCRFTDKRDKEKYVNE